MGFAAGTDADDRACERLIAGLESWNRDLAVPGPAAYGIEADAWFGKLDLMAEQALASGSPGNNPRVPEKHEIIALYREVWTGSNTPDGG